MKYLTLFALLFLCGCQEENKDYAWYMQHPRQLQQASQNCQARKDDVANCEMIFRAAVNMTALVNQMQKDPEKFGESVLNAEQRLAELSSEDQVKYKEQELDVKSRLAALGLASPD